MNLGNLMAMAKPRPHPIPIYQNNFVSLVDPTTFSGKWLMK